MKKTTRLLLAACLFLFTYCTKKSIAPATSSSPEKTVVTPQTSGPGDVVGKVTVGYQGWFAAIGDSSPINAWWHWSTNWAQAPSPSNVGIKSWPDIRNYAFLYNSAFSNLGNGQPAALFSSYNSQSVYTHFLWMQQNGIDAAALQRFDPNGQEGPTRNAVTARVRAAAEAYSRKFYIMYDVSGWTNMQSEIKTDWTNNMSAYTSSSAYAHQNGKPVVCIWGFGFNDSNHNFDTTSCLDVINFFKGQGCYVIGGVPREWRTGVGGSRAGYTGVYHAFNMLSPWLIGAVGNTSDADNIYSNFMVPDEADCKAHGVDYQPCVLPGDLSEHQRSHGDLMWRMFYNAVRTGVQGIYISMFDEYNEGNQIAKTAENSTQAPSGAGFVTLDEDGTACSSDYYLRLTGDGDKMFKGQIALTATRPTTPFVNPAPIGQSITLKGSNGLYVSSNNGSGAMTCNKSTASTSEHFTIVDAGNGLIALQSGGKYVSSENGANPITCNRTAIGPWESFNWVANPDGTMSLEGNNGLYISSENGTISMTCNRIVRGGWESFQVNQ